MKYNPYDKYKSQSVNTATREELTLMLYDGAVKFCNLAMKALEEKDYPKTHENIIKVQDILREFQITLDKSYEISNQLDQLYDYLHYRIMQANIKKDPVILEEVREHLRTLRDTWKEAMKLAKQSPSSKQTPPAAISAEG